MMVPVISATTTVIESVDVQDSGVIVIIRDIIFVVDFHVNGIGIDVVMGKFKSPFSRVFEAVNKAGAGTRIGLIFR